MKRASAVLFILLCLAGCGSNTKSNRKTVEPVASETEAQSQSESTASETAPQSHPESYAEARAWIEGLDVPKATKEMMYDKSGMPKPEAERKEILAFWESCRDAVIGKPKKASVATANELQLTPTETRVLKKLCREKLAQEAVATFLIGRQLYPGATGWKRPPYDFTAPASKLLGHKDSDWPSALMRLTQDYNNEFHKPCSEAQLYEMLHDYFVLDAVARLEADESLEEKLETAIKEHPAKKQIESATEQREMEARRRAAEFMGNVMENQAKAKLNRAPAHYGSDE